MRHRQGRRQELFHPATPGGHHARPVGRLPIPASDSASKNETATSWSREEPQRRSHFRSDVPLSRSGGLSRRPSPQCGSGSDDPTAASREPLTSRRGAQGWSVRRAQARERQGGESHWAGRARPRPHPPRPGNERCGPRAGEYKRERESF